MVYDNKQKILYNNYDEIISKRIQSNNRNVIIENENQLKKLTIEALKTNENKALHLGRIDKEIILKINKKIQNLPKEKQDFLKNKPYDLIINQSEIRHLLENKNSLSKNDIIYFVKVVPNIIVNNDSVSYTKNEKHEGLRFKKLIENGIYVSFVITSNKGTMKVQTIYMEKKDYKQNKRGVSLSNDVYITPNNTSKTNKA